MSARRRLRRNGGFTLIELMISMALSTVGLLGLLALQMIAIRGNMMSRNFSEAIGIAQQRLEIATSTPYTSLATLAETGTPFVSPDGSTAQAIYTRITTIPAPNADNTTNISVTVSWLDTGNASHSIKLATKRSP